MPLNEVHLLYFVFFPVALFVIWRLNLKTGASRPFFRSLFYSMLLTVAILVLLIASSK
ncbi:MAG: hypothetical protein AMXMBFR84_43470 [Candidatus Hydrogenedentota bacterium]